MCGQNTSLLCCLNFHLIYAMLFEQMLYSQIYHSFLYYYCSSVFRNLSLSWGYEHILCINF